MYAWIWRHIPFKQWQLKLLVSTLLVGAVVALLWYQVFPVVEPILPFDDVQVDDGTGFDGGAGVGGDDPAGSPAPNPLPS